MISVVEVLLLQLPHPPVSVVPLGLCVHAHVQTCYLEAEAGACIHIAAEFVYSADFLRIIAL